MAVLNKIRERSVFLIIIIALALFSFVLADVIRNGGFAGGKSQNEIASINGETIERTEFAQDVENYQNQVGPNMSSMQVVNQMYNAKVREIVLKGQFEELGIDVGEAQIKNTLQTQLAGNPNFSDESGNFSSSKLQEYIANIKATSPQAYQQWLDYEDQVAQSAKENIYFNMIKAGVGATLLEGEKAYMLENESIDVQYVQIPWSSVDDSEVKVSKDDISTYIKNHEKEYTVEAGRDIQYVLFAEAASKEDKAEIKADVEGLRAELQSTEDVETFVNTNSDMSYNSNFVFKKALPSNFADTLYNLNDGEVFGPYEDRGYLKLSKLVETKQMPDSAKARHILVSYSGLQTATDVERTKEEAETLSDSLLTVLKKDKSKFAELASNFSADQSNKDNGGDLGFFTPGQMVPAFNDYVFENKVGDLGIVETRFGYHIIEIEEQTDMQKAVSIATIAREIQPSENTTDQLFTETTKFEIASKKGDFTTVTKDNEYVARPVKDMKALDENIPGIGPNRTLVNWAFNDETEVGDIKRFDVPIGYIVAQVTGSFDKGLQSVENASATVTPILKKNKKAAIIKSRITGSTLNEIASSQNTALKSASALNLNNPTLAGSGREPEVVGAAFSVKAGELSTPIQGKNGVYVVKVLKRNEAAKLDNYKAFAVQETNKRTQAVNSKVYNALKEAAEIEDNRAAFY